MALTPARPILRARNGLVRASNTNGAIMSMRPRAPLAAVQNLIMSGSCSGLRAASTSSIVTTPDNNKRERVVILGSGWAGYSFARSLDPKKYERVLISPRSYFVFTPLVAGTAVGTLEFRATLEPVRRLGLDAFHQGWADGVDFAKRTVRVEANTSADEVASWTQGMLQKGEELSAEKARQRQAQEDAEGAVVTAVGQVDGKKHKNPVFDVPYDKLVVAVGSYSQTFGIEGVKEHAHFLRDVGDARKIRMRVLQAFERAALPTTTDDERRRLLHFAIVGGGPTGIEFAAELHDLVHEDLRATYPETMPFVKITVYDVAPKVLPMFDATLARYAMDTFHRAGIEVKTEHHLTRIRPDDGCPGTLRLRIREYGDDEVGAGLVVWSTGLMQNPLVEKLSEGSFVANGGTNGSTYTTTAGKASVGKQMRLVKDEKTGGLLTDEFLRVRTTSAEKEEDGGAAAAEGGEDGKQPKPVLLTDVYAIGDCAVIPASASSSPGAPPPLPATAQVASQKAAYLAKTLNAAKQSGGASYDPSPFRFKDWGTMTYLGSRTAIHQKKPGPDDKSNSGSSLRGWAAWVLWRGAYLTRTVSLRNKIMVPVYWCVSWVFGRDISRF